MLPLIADDGYMNVGTVFYFTSYTIVVNWTLLQVRTGARPRPRLGGRRPAGLLSGAKSPSRAVGGCLRGGLGDATPRAGHVQAPTHPGSLTCGWCS